MVEKATEVLPKLRFPQYAEPWKKGPIGKHIEFVSGVALPGNEISEEKGGVAILRGINITEGSVRHSPDIDRYYHGSLDGIDHLLLKEGDLVLGMDGSKVGKNTAVISKEDEGSLLIQRVARIRPTGTASIDFIYHHIFSYRFHDYVDVVNTSSGIPHISGKQIRDFEVAFPTLPEQQKIAAFLGAVDRKIQQLKRKQELLERYKQGVVQQLFSQELRFKRKDGGEYSEWEEKRLGDVATVNPSTGRLPESFVYIDLESVENGMLLKETVISAIEAPSRAQRVLRPKDVLFQLVRPYQMNNLYFERKGDYVASTGYAVLRAKGDPRFLFQYLHYLPFVNEVLERSTGSNYPAIRPSDLADIMVPVPSLEEQSRIAGFLMALDAKVAGVAQAVAAAQKWKKGLLQQMFV